jgi:2-hydroxychromene-2-carboxylate isomerase
MKKIDFFFDFLSPYSYLAWTKVRSLEMFKTIEINYIPVAIPAIISAYETKGPGQIKAKRNFLTRDLLRYTTLQKIPFRFPKNLPFNSLYALRLSLVEVSKENQFQLIDLFFRAAWENGLDLGESEVIEKILIEHGLDALNLMEQISSKEVKNKLRKNIDYALENEVFGVPSFLVTSTSSDHKELFWGNDSIQYLEMYLNDNDPMSSEDYNQFLKNYPM